MPTYLEWLIQIVAVVVISIWIRMIRHYISAGLGISPQTSVTTMLWVVSLIVVVLSDASRAHLLWLFPLIFILCLVLIFVFPFTLLRIPADIFVRLCCIGIHTELTDSAANNPYLDKHLYENHLTGDWTYGAESEDVDGTWYLDLGSIEERDGYVYYWWLIDLVEPLGVGRAMSVKSYRQADCNEFRLKVLKTTAYSEPMGKGTLVSRGEIKDDWIYPAPGSSGEMELKAVCDHVALSEEDKK